jgi:putative endonuclease
MATHNETGKKGEQLALEYLQAQGYLILEKNWTYKNYELDIIAQRHSCLHVVEVKTRCHNYLTEPELWVARNKQQQILKAAHAYVLQKNIDMEVQFDIIRVVLTGDSPTITHIEDAFYARL